MATVAPTATFSFGRKSTRGVLLGLTWAQLTCCAFSLVTVLTFTSVGQQAGFAFSLLVVIPLLLLAFLNVQGRKAVAWLSPVSSTLIKRQRKQDVFRGGPFADLPNGPTKGKGRPLGSLNLPGEGAALRVLPGVDGAALVQDPWTQQVTAVLRVQSPGLLLEEPAVRDRRVAAWGQALAGMCQSGLVARAQWSARTVPESEHALTRHYAEHGINDGSLVDRAYADLIAGAGPAAERTELYVSIAVDVRKHRRQVSANGGGLAGIASLLGQAQRSLWSALQVADVAPIGWLGAEQLAAYVRTAYDPESSSRLDAVAAATGQVMPALPLAAAGPMAAQEKWGHYRSDSAVHATFWFSEWPRTEVDMLFLHPLLLASVGARRTVTMVMEPIPAGKAHSDIRRERTELMTDQAQRDRIGQLTDARHQAEHADVLKRESELVAGHGDLKFTGMITVSAPDLEALQAACARLEGAATEARVEVQRMWGEQDQAFLAAALPFCRGLR